MMRSFLIALSGNRPLQAAIVRVALLRRMSRRFVAGETLADAIAAVQKLNAQGISATLDHLGENVTSEAEATAAANEYLLALDAIHNTHVDSGVSVKLTQMGLDLGDDFCFANVSRVVRRAADLGIFVRVDMEGSPYTERTIALYRGLARDMGNVGIVIQAYLRRSAADVSSLVEGGIGRFRLCKGAYDEPAAIAYRERAEVTRSFTHLISIAMSPAARSSGAYCAIASHDEAVIDFARAYAYQHDLSPADFEFQMLYGIRRELQQSLVRRGYRMRVYVPYGTHWYPYFMRRLAERPANLLFFLRAFVGD